MSDGIVAHVVDRSGWPSGPWDSEPDREHWVDEATGLDCLIVRNRAGGLCGYVGVPQGHPWYGVEYDSIPECPEVHGGLTYSDHCSGHICHTPAEAANEPVWWIGFDCVHSGDRYPSERERNEWYSQYRTIAYVRNECVQLAAQVAAVN